MPRAKAPKQPSTICRFFSKPGGCRNGDNCRFRHTHENRPSSPEDLTKATNNQNPPPDCAVTHDDTITYTKDTQYYCLDDIGVFLVDNVLFRVHATQVFGPRPASIPEPMEGISPIHIEDILLKLPSSSDSNPIVLTGVTVKQFRNYLLAITCRPDDAQYPTLATGYNEHWGCDKLQDVYTLYLNIATLARLFGVPKLEGWAMDVLYSIFANPHHPLTKFALVNWSVGSLIHLRNLSRNTKLDQPAMRFIQYLVSVNLNDTDMDYSSANVRACVDLYDIIKNSDDDPILLGCVFLNLLSLGHRSLIWSERVSRKDRAILYAAQVRFADAIGEFQNLEWLTLGPPHIELAGCPALCRNCQIKLNDIWRGCFGTLGRGLGSGHLLKDVSLLSQLAKKRWEFYQNWKDTARCCWHSLPNRLTDILEANIQALYEKVASRYRELAEEV